ncbi:MAG: endolytic transglycosylase MltG [Pseudomonadota bacterium]|nr:endolytic transglycosylase MltG [Pseudomonadota bacterium]
MNRVLRWSVAGACAVLLGAAAWVWMAVRSLDEPLHVAGTQPLDVPPGARFGQIAAALGARRIVAAPKIWALYARWKGLDTAIKAGEYSIEPGMTARDLLQKIVDGQAVLHSLTIVDGWRVEDLLLALRRDANVAATNGLEPATLMQKLGTAGTAAEGQFLPQTYRFGRGTSDLELLRQSHAALNRVLDAAWRNRDADLPLRSAYELLIMASIVEKESGIPAEIGKIAGVYLHRLSIGMRLQADPTVIYGLGQAYAGSLHAVDLRSDGPYNTYSRSGLPPTPICLPGEAAIMATAHPQKTDALYFVASPKGDGSHAFSATLQEHNAAVSQYLDRPRRHAAGKADR